MKKVRVEKSKKVIQNFIDFKFNSQLKKSFNLKKDFTNKALMILSLCGKKDSTFDYTKKLNLIKKELSYNISNILGNNEVQEETKTLINHIQKGE